MARLALRNKAQVYMPGELNDREWAELQEHRRRLSESPPAKPRDYTVAKWVIVSASILVALAMVLSFAWQTVLVNADLARDALETSAEIAKSATSSKSEDRNAAIGEYMLAFIAVVCLLGFMLRKPSP